MKCYIVICLLYEGQNLTEFRPSSFAMHYIYAVMCSVFTMLGLNCPQLASTRTAGLAWLRVEAQVKVIQ